MKRIKKLFSIFLIFLLTFSLSSCTFYLLPPVVSFPDPFSHEFEYDVNKITKIEIYYFDEPVEAIKNGFLSVQVLNEYSSENSNSEDLDDLLAQYTYTPICVIEENLYNEFISDYNALPSTMWLPWIPMAVDPTWTYDGYIAKIYFNNSEIVILDGTHSTFSYCEDEDWYNFLKKYIGEEQFNANSN